MVGGRSNVSDAFAKQIFDAIEIIRSKKKSPDCISIHNYITHHNAANLDEKAVQEANQVFFDKTLLKNTPTADSNSYYITPQDRDG